MNHIFSNVEETLQCLALQIQDLAKKAIEERGIFTISLSGGSSPKKLYQLLADEPFHHGIDWNKVYFFFGDERYVPKDHPDSNYRMVKTVLLDVLSIPDDQVFPFNTQLSPEESAKEYFRRITEFFKSDSPVFDLVLLGLGDNSHTASLFPFTDILLEDRPGVSEVYLQDQKIFRLSLNAPLINLARNISFLVYGLGKAEAVRHIQIDPIDIELYPAQLIRKSEINVSWFMDQEAASLL